MELAEILFDVRGSAAWLTIDRPAAMNAITPQVLRSLDTVLDRIDADSGIRSVVITGAGKAFCAGADLKAVRAVTGRDDGAATVGFVREASRVFGRLESLAKPVIAAVNGLCMAGGLELVLCCDIVFAAQGALFGDAHVNFALLPGGGASARLPAKIGVNNAKWLFLSGESLPAESLRAMGLVNVVVPPDGLHAAVDEFARKLAAKSGLALERMKLLGNHLHADAFARGLDFELATFGEHVRSFDMHEGLAAFSEKRSPSYRDV